MASKQKRQRVRTRRSLERLITAFGRKCYWCGCYVRRTKVMHAADRATADHLIPKSEGGRNEDGNVVLACFRCNNRRGNMPVDEWLRCIGDETLPAGEIRDLGYPEGSSRGLFSPSNGRQSQPGARFYNADADAERLTESDYCVSGSIAISASDGGES